MRKLFRSVWGLYNIWHAGTVFVYMLQSVEYRAAPYLAWFWQTQDITRVMHRRTLDQTRAARALRFIAVTGMIIQFVLGLELIYAGVQNHLTGGIWFGLALIISYPVVWANLLGLVVAVGTVVVVKSREKSHAAAAKAIFAAHPGLRIAIAGSYGKTSMKELLATVLSEGRKVAATPANMNVLSSHLRFARSLAGDEDIVLVEFGEGKPGDVKRFSDVVRPTHAVITGLAPAHLDQYKTIDAAGADIFSVTEAMPVSQVYVNGESAEAREHLQKGFHTYSRAEVLGWKITGIKTDMAGTSFAMQKGSKTLRLKSQLVGLHQVGPLAFVAALGMEFGLTTEQIRDGVAKTKPFEHRMQPYQLAGAWVIDDTYNGNLEGIRAGTELLGVLKAKRKIYVTPGLVDQGKETATIHRAVGELIAKAKPDVVVLMQNSVTSHIRSGLSEAGFSGEMLVQTDPLDFYQHLGDFLAAGDVVLMQNDWTDNYK